MGGKVLACVAVLLLQFVLGCAEEADDGMIQASVMYCDATTGVCKTPEEVKAETAKTLERRIWHDDEWEEWWTVDRTRTYFLNKATQKTQWEDPRKATTSKGGAVMAGDDEDGGKSPKKKGRTRKAKKRLDDEL
eukprot:jgi/Mesvir1/769/Mv17370-RA.1